MNNVFVIIAAVLSGFSRMAKSFEMIMLSRFFTGINAGMVSLGDALVMSTIKINVCVIKNSSASLSLV